MYSRGVTAFLFLTHFFAKQCDGLVDSYGPSGFRITFSEKGNLRRGCLARVAASASYSLEGDGQSASSETVVQ
jgi:hypothetical protein